MSADQPTPFWFLNNRCAIHLSGENNADRLSVIETELPCHDGPPLHVHHGEDEVFHILDGAVKFEVDGAVRLARKGDTLFAPRGSRHAFRVMSPEGARMLTVTRGGFEAMVRALARPAEAAGLPEAMEPTPAMQAHLAGECARRNIEIVGPPLAA